MEILPSRLKMSDRWSSYLCSVTLFIFITSVECQYDDNRCKCICPDTQVVSNSSMDTLDSSSQSNRKLYINNVVRESDQCTCDYVVLPLISNSSIMKGKEGEFCLRCACRYESRNTSIIKFAVFIVIGIVSLLINYMLFLMCLDPWLNKRIKSSAPYQEHTNEDDDDVVGGSRTSHPMHLTGASAASSLSSSAAAGSSMVATTSSASSSGVLNRVGLHQNKWRKQVQEQRKNIYDKHTMLN